MSLGFVAFQEGGPLDAAMFADEPSQPLLSPRLLFHGKKRGQRLGRVGGVLKNRSNQCLAVRLRELGVREGEPVQRVLVVEDLVEEACKRT